MPYRLIDTSLRLETKHHELKQNDLTLKQKLEIIKFLSHKVSQSKLATEFDCSKSTISEILCNILAIPTQIFHVIFFYVDPHP